MPDPFDDQAAALAAHVATADADRHRRHDTGIPVPQAARDAITRWLAAEVTAACPHLDAAAPQPLIGYLAAPGLVYCLDCARTVATVYSAGPCDLCGDGVPVHGVTHRLGDVGHLAGQCCQECLS